MGQNRCVNVLATSFINNSANKMAGRWLVSEDLESGSYSAK